MKMKKRISLILTVLLVVSLAFAVTACGPGNQPAPPPPPAEENGEENGDAGAAAPNFGGLLLNMGTGTTGGTYFALGGAMATTWANNLQGLTVTPVATGASVENLNRLNDGDIDLGLAMNNVASASWHGDFPFDRPERNFRAIGVVYPEMFQIVASAASGITSLDDIRGARVAIGPPGSGTAVVGEQLLRVMGIDVDNDITAHRTGFADASSLLQDGHIDVIFAVLGVPASAIVELEVTTALNFLEISEDLYRLMVAEHPYFERVPIPAGTYSNTEDVYILSCQAVLYACYTLDEELVYHLTRVFFENASETAMAHAMGRYILLETALEGITTPFHLGAVRFFESVGITVPSNLIID